MGVDIRVRCEVVSVKGDADEAKCEEAYRTLLACLEADAPNYQEGDFGRENGEWPEESRWHEWYEECWEISTRPALRDVAFIVDYECDEEGYYEERGYFLNGKAFHAERPPFTPPPFEEVFGRLSS